MALFGRRKKRVSPKRGRGRARRVYRRARGVVRRARAALGGGYRMGLLPKVSWSWWVLDAVIVPVTGDGRYWGGAKPVYDQYMASGDPKVRARALGMAYEEAREVFFARTSGFSPRAGAFGAHGGHEGDHMKMAIAPITSTIIDWGQSRITGNAGRKVRVGPVQIIGSK